MFNAFLLTLIAGLSTALGGLIVFLFKKPKFEYLTISMGFAAGVMIFISFVELLGESLKSIGYVYSMAAFFIGILIIYIIDILVPHSYKEECPPDSIIKNVGIKRCGILIAIGVTIHNFPEGIAVFFSSLANIRLGIIIAFAIALHNIPEGIAIAMPIYYGTNSKLKAFMYSLLSGIVEPIAAVVAFLFLYKIINNFVLSIVLAAVAGIMVFISFDELLPMVYKHKNHHHVILGIFIGMFVMALSLYFI